MNWERFGHLYQQKKTEPMDHWSFDFIIVGAGFSGLVLAERLCSQMGKTCLIVEKRDHIGGNAHDEYSDEGVLVHKYGPHYFRTNSERVKDYLSNFTRWNPVNYQLKSWSDGRYWSFPINLNTFEQYLGHPSTSEAFQKWLDQNKVKIEKPTNSEEIIVSQVGWELYRLFFEGYTKKQWRRSPKELDPSVCGRIPIRTDRNDNYLVEKFQALPDPSYSKMFNRMLDACGSRVRVLLKTDYREVLPHVSWGHMIYTGPVDEYFDCKFGRLPYRSLRFERESFTGEALAARGDALGKAGYFQPALQVNYPNENDYTRIVEIKHATGQATANTTIVREYPEDYGVGKEPYYPVPTADSKILYQKYRELAEQEPNVTFVGRLAKYIYYNMDQCVASALHTFDKIKQTQP